MELVFFSDQALDLLNLVSHLLELVLSFLNLLLELVDALLLSLLGFLSCTMIM